MKTLTLQIDGMHCTSCAMNIDFDLEDLKGVKSARTNYARQETIIEFDDKLIDISTLLDTIKSTGYKALIKSS